MSANLTYCADHLNSVAEVVAEVDANGNTVSTFVYGTGINVPDYMLRGGTTYYFVRDHLGSVRFVVDTATGAIAQEMRYDEFGNVTTDTSPGFQPFGYAGGLYDPATGLVRFGVRDYDPIVGRWTAPDPIGFDGGQSNLYGYVANSPMALADHRGEGFDTKKQIFAAAIAVVAGSFFNGAANSVEVSGDTRTKAKAFGVGAAYGWLNVVPYFGPQWSGRLTAQGNLDSCLVAPENPEQYVEQAGEHSTVGSMVGSGLGVFGPGFLVAGAAIGSGTQVLLGAYDTRSAPVKNGLKNAASSSAERRRRLNRNPRDFINSNNP